MNSAHNGKHVAGAWMYGHEVRNISLYQVYASLKAVDEGLSFRQAGKKMGVTADTVIKWWRWRNEHRATLAGDT